MYFFTFQWPMLLPLLALLYPVGILLARARKERAALLAQMSGGESMHRIGRDRLRLIALGLLLLSLARPGYAPERFAVSKAGRDVVFAIDVSQSMLATDSYPSRLEAAKQGVRDALSMFTTERAGLVIYAGSASILCPLTYDYDFLRYMLDQAQPRSVDFGGTTLLSAVEKSIDQIFVGEREGYQDLLVFTDGEDHGPDLSKVSGLLNEKNVGLLLIGLGDRVMGARIPVEGEDGNVSYLKHDGVIVFSKLNNTGLKKLASLAEKGRYIEVGTRPFNTVNIYLDYASSQPVEGAIGENTVVVYKEAAFFLMVLALLLILLAERIKVRVPATMIMCLLPSIAFIASDLKATAGVFKDRFEAAVVLHSGSNYDDAIQAYSNLAQEGEGDEVTSSDISIVLLNEGLCYYAQGLEAGKVEARLGLEKMLQAQYCFLEAKRMSPELERAGKRLDVAAESIHAYQQTIAEEEAEEQAIQAQLEDLIVLLQALLDDQVKLRNDVASKDVDRRVKKKRGSPAPPVKAPLDAGENAIKFSKSQQLLSGRGHILEVEMKDLNKKLSPPTEPGVPPVKAVLEEPIRLMERVVKLQLNAVSGLKKWINWPSARNDQANAASLIEEILLLLGANSSSEGESEDNDEGEEDWDMYEESDMDGGEMMPLSQSGDFAKGSDMQPLPVPNYSLNDILMEESGKQQFRQQQRAKANAGKVKKDW